MEAVFEKKQQYHSEFRHSCLNILKETGEHRRNLTCTSETSKLDLVKCWGRWFKELVSDSFENNGIVNFFPFLPKK